MKSLSGWLLVCSLLASSAWAREVAGVKIPDAATLQGEQLKLNGAGIRTRFFVKVYVGALYLAQTANAASAVLSDSGPKRISLHLLRELKAEQVSSALNEGLKANNSTGELAQLDAKIKEFTAIMNSIGSAKKGSVIDIDYLPGKGTQVSLDGEAKGTVSGEEFNRALMKVWLGDKPVEDSLKKAMLGG